MQSVIIGGDGEFDDCKCSVFAKLTQSEFTQKVHHESQP